MSPAEPAHVSVVTPVYNGESFLRECIESVLAQTWTNWDYTIVDNCSTDRTPEIAKDYAARDPRIRVVRNDRLVRAVENHNIALRQAAPQACYCKVVAADDWLFPECLERMVAVADAHPSVAIVGAYGLRNGVHVAWDGLPFPSTFMPGRDVCRLYLLHDVYVFGAPTSLLFRADVVRARAAFFNESNVHADTEACFEVLQHHDFGFVHQVLTFMREHKGSLSADAERLKRNLASRLNDLVKFGPVFLGPAEHQARLRELLGVYYHDLGAMAVRGASPQFWAYHREKLAALGMPLDRGRLARATAAFAAGYALNLNNIPTLVSRLVRGRARDQ